MLSLPFVQLNNAIGNESGSFSLNLNENYDDATILSALGASIVAIPFIVALGTIGYDFYQKYTINKKTSYQLLQDAQGEYEKILNYFKPELELIPYFDLNQKQHNPVNKDKELSDKKNYVTMNAVLAYQIKQKFDHSFPLTAYISTIEKDDKTLRCWIKILADREKQLLYSTTANISHQITEDLRTTLDQLNVQEYQLQLLVEQLQLLKSLIMHSNEYKTELLLKGKNSTPNFPPLYHHPIFNPGNQEVSTMERPFPQIIKKPVISKTKNALSALLEPNVCTA